MEKIIYDIGANKGDNIPYYLQKGEKVIAVEANPELCEEIRQRFSEEIQSGRLVVESCVATTASMPGEVDFYLHNKSHIQSQLLPPSAKSSHKFTRRRLFSKPVSDLIKEHGVPHFIKIDVEHYDALLLKSLFEHGIRPPFISAESHSIEVFLVLVTLGNYKAFKLIDGDSIPLVYADRWIKSETRQSIRYSFPRHSAGPFGNDIDGEWMSPENFLGLLAHEGLGWKDIHATSTECPGPLAKSCCPDPLVTLGELLSYYERPDCQSLLNQVNNAWTDD